jgi:two-component SAPR family response regulator
MPDLDGWGFLEEFAKVKSLLVKNVEVYIISSSGHLKDINKAKSIPEVKGYIQKPVTKDKLRELVKPQGQNQSL